MFNQPCPLCPKGRTFTSQAKLVEHVTIHHKNESGDILFECCQCHKTYQNHRSLLSHIRRLHDHPSDSQASDLMDKQNDSDVSDDGNDSQEEDELLKCVFEKAISILSLEKQLNFKAASLLIKLNDVHNCTQNVVQTVMSGVDSMISSVLDVLQNKFSTKGQSEVFSVPEIVSIIEQLRGQTAFEGVQTPEKLKNFIDREQGLVEPVKVVLKQREVIKDNIVKTIDVDFAYVVPFLPSLEKILNCPEVLHSIKNPLPVKPGVFSSPLDSYFYQSHPIVKDDPHTLGVGLYADGVDLTDSASSKSGVHPVTFIYFVLFNIHPKLRSSVRAIFLLGCVKSSFLKTHGYSKILEDFINIMNKLSSKEGIKIRIGNEEVVFHGIFICFCGDNPASENAGGFKESHFASRPCRQCFVSREDLFKSFREGNFKLRTMNLHEDQVKEVEVYLKKNVSERRGENPSVAYGINQRSPLMAITGCDVTKCFPRDYMHDTLEGTLKLDVCFLLLDVINKKQMTLNVINERIQVFAKHFGVNKPSSIEMQYLEKKRLRQTASEMLSLAYILPFVLRKKVGGEMVSVCSENNLKCYLLRLQLMTSLMAEEFTHSDIEYISKLTEKHHLLFYTLYNYATPKMHYEVHTHQIMLYGPPRHYWCFRFEGKHAYFKRFLRIYRCFKDPSGTFARSHQRKQCGLMLMSSKGDGGPFLKSSDSFGAPREKCLQSLLHSSGLLNVFLDIPRDVILSSYRVVSLNGVTYRKANAIVVSVDGGQPVFGEIAEIVVYGGKLAFMYKQLATQHFNETLHAFKVTYCVGVDYGVVLASDLPHCHELFIIKSIGAYHIIAPNRNFGPKMKLR